MGRSYELGEISLEQFLVEIDYVLELLNQAHWTDYLVITLMYLILILMMIGKWKKSKRQIWYNYLWLMLCPPVGIYLVSQNRKIKKKEKKTSHYHFSNRMGHYIILYFHLFRMDAKTTVSRKSKSKSCWT